MRILGIDPGTAITGFGLIEKTGQKLTFVEAGAITTPKDQPMSERLITIHEELASLIKEFKPDQAAVELLYFARNVTTAITVGQARSNAAGSLFSHRDPPATSGSRYWPYPCHRARAGSSSLTRCP